MPRRHFIESEWKGIQPAARAERSLLLLTAPAEWVQLLASQMLTQRDSVQSLAENNGQQSDRPGLHQSNNSLPVPRPASSQDRELPGHAQLQR